MNRWRRTWCRWGMLACIVLIAPGCATVRQNAPSPDLRPCTDGFTITEDGWRLGIRRIRPARPDPGKRPVVLCHGLGLNGTFWTITDDHLPGQLAARGYDVFIVDMRGSGASRRVGPVGNLNSALRQTPLLEIGEGRWSMDDEARYDVPAILDYIERVTGQDRVNWVGHSLGGMLMFAHLEMTPRPERIATFVGMGSPAILADSPERDMLRANRGLRVLLRVISSGRIARPMKFVRPPGLDRIDSFYYTADNVDPRTVSRFYGYTLEDPGRGALKQLDPYLEFGHLVSADGQVDYFEGLPRITTPTLIIAGVGDSMVDIASSRLTFEALRSPDKSLLQFGLDHGHRADYGHCDLVWSRNAPLEVFPPLIDWLDRRQPGALANSGPFARQEGVETDARPRLEPVSKAR